MYVSSALSAQNWQPFTFNEAYYYFTDSSEQISAGYTFNQLEVDGIDTIGYFNLVLMPMEVWDCGSQSPQYWERSMKKMGDDAYVFSGAGTKVLHTQAQLGDFWTFNTMPLITAQIQSMDTLTLFGVPDSIKVIGLSNGDSIVLSKSFGLIAFPTSNEPGSVYQHLSGINGRDIGTRLPDFTDYFDWQAGDLFQWESIDLWNDIGDYGETTIIHKMEVISATMMDTMVEVELLGNSFITYVEEDALNNYTAIQPFHDTITILASENTFATAMPLQYLKLEIRIPGITYQEESLDLEKAYGIDSTNRAFIYDPNLTGEEETIAFVPEDTLVCSYWPWGTVTDVIYTVGLGCTSWKSHGVETYFSFKLTAYRKGADTVGVFLVDSDFVASLTEKSLIPIHLYPNPSSQYIICELPFPASANTYYQIFDMQGNRIAQQSISQSTFNINLETFPNALYNLVIMDGKQQYTKRFIKSNG